MENQDFFDNAFKNFQKADNRIKKKKDSLRIFSRQWLGIATGWIGLSAAFCLCINTMFYFFSSASFKENFLVATLLTILFSSMVFFLLGEDIHDHIKEKISLPEQEMRDKLEKDFFIDIKNNREYLQDLASLVVDEPTHNTFSGIVDSLKDASHHRIYHHVLTLIEQNKQYLQVKEAQEARDSFLKKECVSLAYRAPKKELKKSIFYKTSENYEENIIKMLINFKDKTYTPIQTLFYEKTVG